MAIINNENGRRLLEKFRDFPELWEVTCEQYKNKPLKAKAWEKLLPLYLEINPNGTVDILKKKLANMRSCYKRELKKMLLSEQSAAEADEIHVPTLWYFHNLDFLRDVEMPMPSAGNVEIFEEEDLSDASCTQSSKRGRTSEDYFIQKALQYMENARNRRDKSDAEIFAEAWKVSFSKLTEEQSIYAKRIIDETLVLGQLGKLSLDSKLVLSPSYSATRTAAWVASTIKKDNIIPLQRTPTPVQISYSVPVLNEADED